MLFEKSNRTDHTSIWCSYYTPIVGPICPESKNWRNVELAWEGFGHYKSKSKIYNFEKDKKIYDSKDLASTLDLDKGKLKVEINFVNMFFNFLIQLNAPKLW